jgi:PAS domain S-box-containing protein
VTRGDTNAAVLAELAIEGSPSGILVVTADGTIVLVNRELERQFGYPRDELIGESVERLLPGHPIHVPYGQIGASAPDGRPPGAARERSARRRDGSQFWTETGLNLIDTEDGSLVLITSVDVTERRRQETENRLAIERQLAFERLVADLSTQFINLPTDELQAGIREALRRLSEVFEIDRSAFYTIQQDGVRASIHWCTEGALPAMPAPTQDLFPWTIQRILAGEAVSFSALADIPHETDRRSYESSGTKSAVIVPLSVDSRIAGAVEFESVRLERRWPSEVILRLTMIASVFAEVLGRQQRDEALRTALAEVERLKDELQAENASLREARAWARSPKIVGQSAAVRRVMELIHQVSATDSTVLLVGETGTGKELFASQIHELSTRRGRTMVRVNCAAIPGTLIESELFGREKGAFTGALSRQVGRFEVANHSTIFLDEIGDLPSEVQVKLLRVLEERQIERLGSPRPISVDTRIIAATHQNLEQRIAQGAFREDLFYRLNVFPICVPPLRERGEDIPLLVWRFVEEFSKAFGKRIDSISKENFQALQQYSWPGNIRELRNVVERAMIAAAGPHLTIAVPQSSGAATRRSPKLVDVETEHIRNVLVSTSWRIRGAGGAADRLGLKPTTLETRMTKLGIKRPVPA